MKNTQNHSRHVGATHPIAAAQTIAVLIKHPHRLGDALRCGLAFMAVGARVSFVCLSAPAMQKGRWHLRPLLETAAECHTDDAVLAQQYGIHLFTPALLGRYLKRTDWVIPY